MEPSHKEDWELEDPSRKEDWIFKDIEKQIEGKVLEKTCKMV